jgi:hypothetical protein
MATTALDTIEGVLDDFLHFHYDVSRDVLYLRLANAIGRDSYSEETDEGLTLVRDMETDKPIGMTIISYWKRYGHKALPEVSLKELQTGLQQAAALFPAA